MGFAAMGQDCPKSSSNGPDAAQTLQGQLIYHDGLRKWFELKLDKARCGQQSIQLVATGNGYVSLETLRGCRVESDGLVGDSPTGYYSLDLNQAVTTIKPIGKCEKQKPFPDFSGLKPSSSVRKYKVVMQVDYEEGDHPVVFRITSEGRELDPWQAYASYILTGGFVLYGQCAKGFVVDKVFGTPEASPQHFTEAREASDMAEFDPESAAAAGQKNMRLGYTCVREHQESNREIDSSSGLTGTLFWGSGFAKAIADGFADSRDSRQRAEDDITIRGIEFAEAGV